MVYHVVRATSDYHDSCWWGEGGESLWREGIGEMCYVFLTDGTEPVPYEDDKVALYTVVAVGEDGFESVGFAFGVYDR